jgi:hypothetical protein
MVLFLGIQSDLTKKRDASLGATSADAADFGLGLLTEMGDNTK